MINPIWVFISMDRVGDLLFRLERDSMVRGIGCVSPTGMVLSRSMIGLAYDGHLSLVSKQDASKPDYTEVNEHDFLKAIREACPRVDMRRRKL